MIKLYILTMELAIIFGILLKKQNTSGKLFVLKLQPLLEVEIISLGLQLKFQYLMVLGN